MTLSSLQLFEEGAKQNGQTYWDARELMEWLGYDTWSAFQKVITRAMASCGRIGVDPTESFIRSELAVDGKHVLTYRLTRFACFLVAMAADAGKPEVVRMQVMLAAITDHLIEQQVQSGDLARLDTRDDLKAAEKAMSQAASSRGVLPEQFGIFKDAGFRGMYNMRLQDLKVFKGLQDDRKTLYDFMGLEEMAGNLFRVTQTTARIRNQNVTGLNPLAETAQQVGREVRGMMIKNSGNAPEHLQLEEDVKDVQRRLKKMNREMKKLDKPKTPRK